MTHTPVSLTPVLMAAQASNADAAAPDWVHLLPSAEGGIRTSDQRGPYRVAPADQLIAASFAEGDRLPIDENHATDLAAPKGMPAPARGWIVELQARADGIWGRVEWTEAGRALVADRAYQAMSPVILHDAGKVITRILRASLVNRPNLRGLAVLNQETTMSLMERLAEQLGLDATATEDQLLAAVCAAKDKKPEAAQGDVALQSAITEIGAALGVEGDAAAILAAARAAKTGTPAQIVALQAEITTLAGKLNTLSDGQARTAAETYVDGEIKRGRVGVKPMRDHYVAMHMADAARVEKEIGALPVLGLSGVLTTPPAQKDGAIALHAAQVEAARQLGIDPAAYAKTLAAERTNEETL